MGSLWLTDPKYNELRGISLDKSQWKPFFNTTVEPQDRYSHEGYGYALAATASKIVVGSHLFRPPHAPQHKAPGAVYIYAKKDGGWNLTRRLVGSVSELPQLGVDVRLSQSWVAALSGTFNLKRSIALFNLDGEVPNEPAQVIEVQSPSFELYDNLLFLVEITKVVGLPIQVYQQVNGRWNRVQLIDPPEGYVFSDLGMFMLEGERLAVFSSNYPPGSEDFFTTHIEFYRWRCDHFEHERRVAIPALEYPEYTYPSSILIGDELLSVLPTDIKGKHWTYSIAVHRLVGDHFEHVATPSVQMPRKILSAFSKPKQGRNRLAVTDGFAALSTSVVEKRVRYLPHSRSQPSYIERHEQGAVFVFKRICTSDTMEATGLVPTQIPIEPTTHTRRNR